ncbi:MAG: hypothetical protein ACYS83_05535 [Planctomycetota bacterium]|jgi:hypothetical protein
MEKAKKRVSYFDFMRITAHPIRFTPSINKHGLQPLRRLKPIFPVNRYPPYAKRDSAAHPN